MRMTPPTFTDETTKDALVVLEAYLQGKFVFVSQHLRLAETESTIQDGSILAYEFGSSRVEKSPDCRC